MQRPRRRYIAASALVAVAVIVGGVLWLVTSSRAHTVEAGGVSVLVDKRYFGSRASAGIGVGGQLTLTDGTCVTLSGPEGIPSHYLIWPHEIEVSGQDEDLVIGYADHTVRIGDSIDGGGDEASDEVIIERFGSVPPGCRGLIPLFLDELASVTGDPSG